MDPIVVLLASSEWSALLSPYVVGSLIPIAAILMVVILGITKLLFRHRERMAMIERGMHPDRPQEQSDSQNPS